MPNLSSLESASYFLALLVPGVVFMYARSQFTNGRMLAPSGAILYYISITAVYYALMAAPIWWAHQYTGNLFSIFLGWVGVLFVAPAALGGFSGWSARREHIYTFLRKLRLNPIHPFPSAWDWKFAEFSPQFMLVTLKNGREFGAWCGEASFLSTDPTERDIYFEKIYNIGKRTDRWSDSGSTGMLVTAGEISTIEFFPDQKPKDASASTEAAARHHPTRESASTT